MQLKCCPICNKSIELVVLNAYALDVYFSEKFHYGKCKECDVLILLDISDAEDEVDYTASGYYQRTQTKAHWLIEKAMSFFIDYRIKLLKRMTGHSTLKGMHLLDIGCGKGKFLSAALREGAQVTGLEPTVRSFEFARVALGDDVQNKMMSKELFSSDVFDVVTMWHVFEHIPNPTMMLDACAAVLGPDGILIVAVPNYKGLVARIGGGAWFNLDPPRHVIHYSPASIKRLLEKSGFEVVATNYSYPELTYFSALQTLLNKLPITKNFLFNYLKKNKQALSPNYVQHFTDASLTLVGLILFAPLVLVFTYLLTATKFSDCITVSARKK